MRNARPAIAYLNAKLRTIPDFPKPGIVFKDLTTLLNDPARFREAIDADPGYADAHVGLALAYLWLVPLAQPLALWALVAGWRARGDRTLEDAEVIVAEPGEGPGSEVRGTVDSRLSLPLPIVSVQPCHTEALRWLT